MGGSRTTGWYRENGRLRDRTISAKSALDWKVGELLTQDSLVNTCVQAVRVDGGTDKDCGGEIVFNLPCNLLLWWWWAWLLRNCNHHLMKLPSPMHAMTVLVYLHLRTTVK